MKNIRHWLIKQGLLSPSNLKEARELFTFPVALKKQKHRSIWMIKHLEKVS